MWLYFIIGLGLLIWCSTREGLEVKSSVDGAHYDVISYFRNHQDSANLLAQIHHFAHTFIDKLAKHHAKSPHPWVRDLVRRLQQGYSRASLTENHPSSQHDVSYVFEKGVTLAVCLRHLPRKPNRFIDFDTLKFVVLHELTHIGLMENGHDDRFWLSFKFLLAEAKNYGLYEPVDYSKKPVTYCGLKLTKNPYFEKIGGTSYL